MTRKLLMLSAAAFALALVLSMDVTAKQQVVVLKTGRRIQGEVTKIETGYQVKTPGGTVVFAADQVAKIEDVVTQQDELEARLAKIDAKDPEALYQLARWAQGQGMLKEARDLLKKVLAIKSDHRQAKRRLELVEKQLASATRPELVATRTAGTRPVRLPLVGKEQLLTKDDIYRIRLMELQEDDLANIQFRNKVLDRFIKTMRGTDIFRRPDGERNFRGAKPVDQARYMLENTDETSYAIRDDILIRSDPKVMARFKTEIWPIVAASCASPSCHGGAEGRGGFKLFNVPVIDERVVYTNFYILHTWSRARGARKLIVRGDRDHRERSLLLQYGLPATLARRRHPGRADPAFQSNTGRKYRLVERWITALRHPFLSPGYRIDYQVPGMPKKTATTQPSPFD